jgi:hypothetical protein
MIAIITEVQKNILIGKKFDGIQFFNPVQDLNDNWVISEEEINQCTNLDLLFIKDLVLTVYEPKISENPLI